MRAWHWLVVAVALIPWSTASAGDWITAPSYYTHDPQSGQRVRQYSPIGPFYAYSRRSLQSGYWNFRSSIQVGQSSDNLHIVREWGRPVRPYGEWLYPYRPYGVPYDYWGPPYITPYWHGYGVPYGPHGAPLPWAGMPGYGRGAISPRTPVDPYAPPNRRDRRLPDRKFYAVPDATEPPAPADM